MAYETNGSLHDHTGSAPAEALELQRFQAEVLSRWDSNVRPTGIYDNPTKLAVTRIQHQMLAPLGGKLDEKTWRYAQENAP